MDVQFAKIKLSLRGPNIFLFNVIQASQAAVRLFQVHVLNMTCGNAVSILLDCSAVSTDVIIIQQVIGETFKYLLLTPNRRKLKTLFKLTVDECGSKITRNSSGVVDKPLAM